MEYYNPQSAQKKISYPTILIVHEIPRARVNPTPEDDHAEMNPLEELTYISLGNPLLLVMNSILNGLNKAFSQALEFTHSPDISQLNPT